MNTNDDVFWAMGAIVAIIAIVVGVGSFSQGSSSVSSEDLVGEAFTIGAPSPYDPGELERKGGSGKTTSTDSSDQDKSEPVDDADSRGMDTSTGGGSGAGSGNYPQPTD